ncbi:MAG: rhomboid family intramembrane serine protease [Ignavibacteriaceae bacterium]|nr:rhomboid family intramembrane serine protease [Ignavibacteriaceae bacterium]
MSYNSYRPMGFSFFPPVLKNLLIINGIVFFITILMENILVGGVPVELILYKWFALSPLTGMGDTFDFKIWQLITYQFMHANFSHIFFNMFALWMFGAEIENLWGSKKFLTYYLMCGVGAGLLHLFVTPLLGLPPAPTVGASGAVYGIMIAFALMFPDRYIYIYFLIPVKAKYLIGFLIMIEILAVDSVNSTVAHLAHIGGAIVGLIFILLDKSIHVPLKDLLGLGFRKRRNYDYDRDYTYQDSGRNSGRSTVYEDISDARVHDTDDEISQEEIDRILDKISHSSYKSLTEREKRILFEASKRMNEKREAHERRKGNSDYN